MSTEKIHYCRTQGKTFRTKTGKTITSPPCGNVRCPRCSIHYRLSKFFRMPINEITIAVHTYCVLPYYSYTTIKQKSNINRHFIRKLKRRYKELAYVVTYEQQHGLYHSNWLLLTDDKTDVDFIRDKWLETLQAYGASNANIKDIKASHVESIHAVSRYIFKTDTKTTIHIPSKEASPRTVTFSRNWAKFKVDRDGEEMIAKLFDK